MSLAFVYTWPVWIHSFSFCPSSHWKGGRKGDSTPPQPPPKWHLTHSSFMLFIHPWPLISRSPVFTNNNSSPIAWIATQLKITLGLACLHSDFWPLQSTIVHFGLMILPHSVCWKALLPDFTQTSALCIAAPSAPRLNGLKGFRQKRPLSEITKSPPRYLEKTLEKSYHVGVDGILFLYYINLRLRVIAQGAWFEANICYCQSQDV